MGLRGKGISPLDPTASYINALLYGASGNGKTTTASTVPGVVAYFVSEPQAKQAIEEQYRIDIGEGFREENSLEIFLVEEAKDERGRVVRTKMEHLQEMLSELEADPQDFTAVVLDSLTDMQSSLVSDIEDQKNGRVQMQDWGKIIRDTEKLAERFRDLKMHTFVITLAQEKTNEDNVQYYRPALKGRVLPDDLPKFFNIVSYIDKVEAGAGADRETKYIARMGSTNKYVTKSPRCFDPIERPNVRLWVSKLNSARESVGVDLLPEKSEVTETRRQPSPEEAKIFDRLENEKTQELFRQIEKYQQVPEAKKIATLRKYRADEKLWEVLGRQIAKLKGESEGEDPSEEKPDKKASKKKAKKADPDEIPHEESEGGEAA